RRDHLAIGKADPLAAILIEKLVADSPIVRFVFASVRMDLPGDFRGELVGNALHRSPRVQAWAYRHYYSPSGRRSSATGRCAPNSSQPLTRRDDIQPTSTNLKRGRTREDAFRRWAPPLIAAADEEQFLPSLGHSSLRRRMPPGSMNSSPSSTP